jgi:hypothetical protein
VNINQQNNAQFPYGEYGGHFCLGILYERNLDVSETKILNVDELKKVDSVIKNIRFFFVEKWKIANDISGSGNTANIGSITKIDDLIRGNGIFIKYGEKVFDDYWMNYGKIINPDTSKKITKLDEFLKYRRIKKK